MLTALLWVALVSAFALGVPFLVLFWLAPTVRRRAADRSPPSDDRRHPAFAGIGGDWVVARVLDRPWSERCELVTSTGQPLGHVGVKSLGGRIEVRLGESTWELYVPTQPFNEVVTLTGPQTNLELRPTGARPTLKALPTLAGQSASSRLVLRGEAEGGLTVLRDETPVGVAVPNYGRSFGLVAFAPDATLEERAALVARSFRV